MLRLGPLATSPTWGWMRFVDATARYYPRLPEPKDEFATGARLFVGVSLNVQQVMYEVFFDAPRSWVDRTSHGDGVRTHPPPSRRTRGDQPRDVAEPEAAGCVA